MAQTRPLREAMRYLLSRRACYHSSMKTLLLFLALSATAQACPSFVGVFHAEDAPDITDSYYQGGCEVLHRIRAYPGGSTKQVYQTDGESHVSEDSEEMLETYVYHWEENKLIGREKTLYRQNNLGAYVTDVVMYLDSSGNLTSEFKETKVSTKETLEYSEFWERVN